MTANSRGCSKKIAAAHRLSKNPLRWAFSTINGRKDAAAAGYRRNGWQK
jgi:hypothetical protein